MSLMTLLIEEFTDYIIRKYWEKDDNGNCWNILPIELRQQIYKNQTLVELVAKNTTGAEIFWDDPHNPMFEIYDKYKFNNSILVLRSYKQIDIYMNNYRTIYFAGQIINIEH